MPPSHSPLAVFRCDASPIIGGGHVMRCLSLARELKNRGWQCSFSTIDESLTTVPALDSSGFEIFATDNTPQEADMLIIDHYDLSIDYEKKSRLWANTIMVIDDLANRPHDCDLLLDQTYKRSPTDYKPLTPKTCKLLCGSDYTLLRPQFAEKREEALQKRKKQNRIENIFISFGATNPENIIQTVLKALLKFQEWPLTFNIMLGTKAQNVEDVQHLVTFIEENTIHTALLYFDAEDVASLMVQNDIAFGGGGTMSWERACLGLPTLMIELEDNQHLTAQTLASVGAVRLIGKLEDIQEADIDNNFETMRNDSELLDTMSKKSFSICCGSGVSLVCDEIEKITGINGVKN